jgi:hypothetical protein
MSPTGRFVKAVTSFVNADANIMYRVTKSINPIGSFVKAVTSFVNADANIIRRVMKSINLTGSFVKRVTSFVNIEWNLYFYELIMPLVQRTAIFVAAIQHKVL